MLFKKLPQVFSFAKFTSNNAIITRLINNTKVLSGSGHQNVKPVEDRSKLPESEKYEWERETRTRIYYGFDYKDEARDKYYIHLAMFGGIGLFLLSGFIVYFVPDQRNREWVHREAHLELSRRMARGEPPVSKDLIPRDQIELPSDEELGDMKIII